jgi:hypothetical protein
VLINRSAIRSVNVCTYNLPNSILLESFDLSRNHRTRRVMDLIQQNAPDCDVQVKFALLASVLLLEFNKLSVQLVRDAGFSQLLPDDLDARRYNMWIRRSGPKSSSVYFRILSLGEAYGFGWQCGVDPIWWTARRRAGKKDRSL